VDVGAKDWRRRHNQSWLRNRCVLRGSTRPRLRPAASCWQGNSRSRSSSQAAGQFGAGQGPGGENADRDRRQASRRGRDKAAARIGCSIGRLVPDEIGACR
jgi:hypothetical protein